MKNYYFTEEHELFRQGLKDFLAKEALFIDDWEEKEKIPRELSENLRNGYLGLNYPESTVEWMLIFFSVVFIEEISKVFSGGFMATLAVQQYMASPYLQHVQISL